MGKFRLIIFLFGFCFSAQLHAQNVKSDSTTEQANWFQQIAESLVLLKNQNNLIPFQRLDTLRLLSTNFWLEKDNVFEKSLQKYSHISRRIPPEVVTGDMDFDAIIIGIEASQNRRGFPVALQKFLQSLPESLQKIIVVFGASDIWNPEFQMADHADVLLFAARGGQWEQTLAAQALFGGTAVRGTLQTDLNEQFRMGQGIALSESSRLGYVPATSESMDSLLLADEISDVVLEGIREKAFPGAQVLVAKNGRIVFHQAWGHHTYSKQRIVQLNDLYDFASITKVTTGLAALMKWHGEGRFDLDAPLKTYFPKFKNANKGDLKMRPILAHHAGLQPWIPYWKKAVRKNGKYKKRFLRRDTSERFSIKLTDSLFLRHNFKKRIYKAIRRSPVNPDQGYVYSGLAFYLLPEIVENISGEKFESYLKNNFYNPLGAHSLTYHPTRHFPLSRIVPTERDAFFRKVQIHGMVHDEGAAMMGGVSCNAGLFGNANDLAKLMQMYLNGGEYGGRRFISEASIQEFTRYQYEEAGSRRGLGFDKPLLEYDPQKSSVAKDASRESFGHSGYTGTFVWADPEHDLLFIFMSNRVHPSRESRKIYELNIRPRIHQVLYDAMR